MPRGLIQINVHINTITYPFVLTAVLYREIGDLPAGSSLWLPLEGCEGCCSSVTATVCPTEPPARPRMHS